MRTLLFLLVSLSFLGTIGAQTIPNSGFENWTLQTLYEEPNGYSTTNPWIYMSNQVGNVTKDTWASHGQFAPRLTTIAGGDTMFSALIIGNAGPSGIEGGMPFTGQPDSVSGYIRHFIQPGDTAFFIIAFKNSGNFIGMAVKTFVGTQSGFIRFSIPTNLPVTPAPDSLIAIFTSSRMDPPRMPGSTVTLDSITMIGSVQQLPNPSFENWTPLQIEEPDNWTTMNYASPTLNPSASKTTTSFSGSYALLLKTVETTWGDTMGVIGNGTFGQNGPEGGMPVWLNPMKVSGYYRYLPNGNDTALAGAFTYINGTTIDSVMLKLNGASAYTYFEMNLTYNSWPFIDTLGIAFSANNPDGIHFAPGSALYIDQLVVTYYPMSTGGEMSVLDPGFFPNPVTDRSVLILDHSLENGLLQILDVTGKVILTEKISNATTVELHKEKLAAGIHFFRLVDLTSGRNAVKGKIVVAD